MSSSVYAYVIDTGTSNESSTTEELISAVTSNTTCAALETLAGVSTELNTGSAAMLFICITTLDDVAVKFGGVTTVIVLPLSESVVVAVVFTVTDVVVADDGETFPVHPSVVNIPEVDVA